MTSLLLLVLAAAAPEVEVRTLEGREVAGRLEELSPERLIVETAQGRVELPCQQLLSLRTAGAAEATAAPTTEAAPRPPIVVHLADGSKLPATDYRVAGKTATLTLSSGRFEVAIDEVAAVQLAPPSPEFDQVWTQAQADQAASDRLVLRNKQANDKFDYLAGVVHDVGAEGLQFDLGGLREVKRERVAGIVYFRAARANPRQTAGLVHDRGGGVWAAGRIALAEGRLVLEVAGQQRSLDWADVRSIDYSAGKIQALAELALESRHWTPFLGTAADFGGLAAFFEPRVDASFGGGPLRLGGKEYARGLAVRSRTELSYRLPAGARRFQATVGIDDRYAPRGHVRLQVFGDAQPLFDEPVAGGAGPKTLDLDIAGARRLKIVVDFGEGGDVADHLNLCEARVTQ
jgi:hypothetical protein